MSLSLDFWFELAAIAIVFGIVITLIPKLKGRSVRKAKAEYLRVQVSEKIKLILPALAATSVQSMDAHGQFFSDTSALKFGASGLRNLLAQAEVLYSEERERVGRFLSQLQALIPAYDSGQGSSSLTEDLVLLGERILEDLRENGLLSHVVH